MWGDEEGDIPWTNDHRKELVLLKKQINKCGVFNQGMLTPVELATLIWIVRTHRKDKNITRDSIAAMFGTIGAKMKALKDSVVNNECVNKNSGVAEILKPFKSRSRGYGRFSKGWE